MGCACENRAAHANCVVKAIPPHDGQKYAAWFWCFECQGVYTGRFKKLMAKRWLDTSVPTKTAYADVYFAAAANYGDALVEAGNWVDAVRFCTDLRSEMLAAVGPDDAQCQTATVNIARAMHGQGDLAGAKAALPALQCARSLWGTWPRSRLHWGTTKRRISSRARRTLCR